MEWINVNKEMPEELETVYVYLDRPLKYGQRFAMSTCYQGEFNDINGSVWPNMPKATHWMRPEPPKED